MDELSKQVGERIRRIRRGQGMSLADLADAAGLSISFLSRVERGERHLERRRHLDAVAACDALIEQGDKYLNPDPTVANYTEFNRYGNRRNDSYNQD